MLTTTEVDELRGAGVPCLVGGRYRLVSPIGTGATGVVWTAWDETLRRSVAVKELPWLRQPSRDAGLREACAAARVQHANAVKVYDHVVDEKDETDWIVMETLDGEDLASTLRRVRFVGVDEARYIGSNILQALIAVHATGLVHRDVKPANIRLCDDGRVVLMDFGLAGTPCVTGGIEQGWVAGSLPYLAPEILSEGRYSSASDLYALGMTLYAAVTGVAPATATYDILRDRRGAPPAISVPRSARPMRELILGLLDQDPTTRLDASSVATYLL